MDCYFFMVSVRRNIVFPDLVEAVELVSLDSLVAVFIASGVLDVENWEELTNWNGVDFFENTFAVIFIVEVSREGFSDVSVGDFADVVKTA